MGGNIVTASPIGDSAPVLLALDAKVVLASLPSRTGVSRAQLVDGTKASQTPGNGGAGETPALRFRTLSISEFFVSYRKTALQAGEILQTIIVPRFPAQAAVRRRCEWYKVSKRREMDISTVAACFAVDLDKKGIVRQVRLAYGGVAAMPSRARRAEDILLGKRWGRETVEEVLPILRQEFQPISDARGSEEYRLGLVTSLFEKFYYSFEGDSA